MLLLDRFLSGDGSALDLATGVPARPRVSARPTGTAIYATRGRWRLVDAGQRSPRAFLEFWARASDVPAGDAARSHDVAAALDDARDGCPRAIDLVAEDPAHWRATALELARCARVSGFVPVDAGVLGELLRTNRWQWPRWLADRSLVVLTCDARLSAAASMALLRLATRDPRPHLVIRGALRGPLSTSRLILAAPFAHEQGSGSLAPHDVASPATLAETCWRQSAEGRTDDEAAAAARWAIILAPGVEEEHTGRAALAVTLAGQGRVLEARAALPVAATSSESPAVEARVAEARRRLAAASAPQRCELALTDDFLRVLEACQAIEDENTTIGRVLVLLRERIAAAGLACVVLEQGAARTLAEVGMITGDSRIVQEALVTNVGRRPESLTGPSDGVWLIRYAGQTIAGLWCRWSVSLPVRPVDADRLLTIAAAALAPVVHVQVEKARGRAETTSVPEIVGGSRAMGELRAATVRAARSPFPVLIEGESGSGKELEARAIHRASRRRDRRFAALNCAALNDELSEAELFGHAKGAFTGAISERPGLFEEATGGTLFLDEVSELSARVQAKLLRVLQEHEVRRLGESHVRPIDTRIVAASNKPLGEEVAAGRFRRDLRYRLDVVRLAIPPLRERLEDVPALVRHLWTELTAKTGSRAVLSTSALAALGRYDWPGNVRELQNVLASVIVSSPPRGTVSADLLPVHVGRTAALADRGTLADARREFERRFVSAALARANGRPAVAARDLGVSRQGLAKLVTRLDLRAGGGGGDPTNAARRRDSVTDAGRLHPRDA